MEALSEQKIREVLPGLLKGIPILTLDEASSTNELAKKLAKEGAPNLSLVLSASQTKGKGQKERSFYSPPGTGLYMSMVLRPSLSADQLSLLTPLAAVCVTNAIFACTGRRPKIKWVNDLYLNYKKICGILAESSININTHEADYVILGIGMNILPPKGGFPKELQDIAGAIYEAGEKPCSVNRLTAKIVSEISRQMENFEPSFFMKDYREYSMLIGKAVMLDGEALPVSVLDIDDAGALVVQKANGSITRHFYGEVQLKRS